MVKELDLVKQVKIYYLESQKNMKKIIKLKKNKLLYSTSSVFYKFSNHLQDNSKIIFESVY